MLYNVKPSCGRVKYVGAITHPPPAVSPLLHDGLRNRGSPPSMSAPYPAGSMNGSAGFFAVGRGTNLRCRPKALAGEVTQVSTGRLRPPCGRHTSPVHAVNRFRCRA